MSEREEIPAARFDFKGFEPMSLADFGADAARRLVGRPLETLTIFEDATTRLPAVFLIFGGGMPAAEGLLLSPRPTSTHPFATLDVVIADGAALDQVKYEQPADQPIPQPDHQWAGRTDVAGQLRGILLHLTAVAAALTSGEPLAAAYREELAGLLVPVISTFEGSLRAETAKREAQQARG
jgi:hypothetical protein